MRSAAEHDLSPLTKALGTFSSGLTIEPTGDAGAGKADEDALWLFRCFMVEAQRLVTHAASSAENIQQAKAGAESVIRGVWRGGVERGGGVGRCRQRDGRRGSTLAILSIRSLE